VGVAVVIAAARFLIPVYGGVGAGIAYSCAYGVVLLLVLAVAARLPNEVPAAPQVAVDVV
jgi:hypothetical protein